MIYAFVVTDPAKVIARRNEFRDAVGKYMTRERGRVRVRLRFGVAQSCPTGGPRAASGPRPPSRERSPTSDVPL